MSGAIPIRVPVRERDRKVGDPHQLKRDNTKSHHMRKGRDDKGFTPTEQRKRDELMRQFMKNPEGTTNTAAYVNAPCWCHCGRLVGSHVHEGDE